MPETPKESNGKEFLKEFYAVTKSGSLYLVNIDPLKERVSMQKIATKTEGSSEISIGELVNNGTMVLIENNVYLYTPKSSAAVIKKDIEAQEVSLMNDNKGTTYFGGCTSPIVALFFTDGQGEKSAFKCVQSENLKVWDVRWKKETLSVFKQIGSTHPRCNIQANLPREFLMG